jgi:hypothetical protein
MTSEIAILQQLDSISFRSLSGESLRPVEPKVRTPEDLPREIYSCLFESRDVFGCKRRRPIFCPEIVSSAILLVYKQLASLIRLGERFARLQASP